MNHNPASDKKWEWLIDRLPWIAAVIGAFLIGVGTGNYATREILRAPIKYADSGRIFCSSDGRVWWPARKDGMCYAADEPR